MGLRSIFQVSLVMKSSLLPTILQIPGKGSLGASCPQSPHLSECLLLLRMSSYWSFQHSLHRALALLAFPETASAFGSPSLFFSFLPSRSLVTWAFISRLLTRATHFHTSLNVGSSVSIINQHFQLAFPSALF